MISALTAGVQDLCLFEAEFLPFLQLLVPWFPLYNHCEGREGTGEADGAPWLTSPSPGGEGYPSQGGGMVPQKELSTFKTHSSSQLCHPPAV